MGFVFVQKEYFHFNRKSSIKQENPQYCEPFRNKVLRFKTSKVNRMNRIILTKTIVLTEFVFHLKNLSAVCTDDTHKNGRLFRGGVAYIYIYKCNQKQPAVEPTITWGKHNFKAL